jgi:hypothetical protein
VTPRHQTQSHIQAERTLQHEGVCAETAHAYKVRTAPCKQELLHKTASYCAVHAANVTVTLCVVPTVPTTALSDDITTSHLACRAHTFDGSTNAYYCCRCSAKRVQVGSLALLLVAQAQVIAIAVIIAVIALLLAAHAQVILVAVTIVIAVLLVVLM